MNLYPQSDDTLVRKVWQIMQQHKGHAHRIERDRLIVHVFGQVTKTYDRQLRDALSELPVIWQDGYFIPETKQEAQEYIASMRSRQVSIGQRLQVLEGYLKQRREPERVEQMKLMEV